MIRLDPLNLQNLSAHPIFLLTFRINYSRVVYFLYLSLFAAFCFLMSRLKFFRDSGISITGLIMFFGVRALAGIAGCWLSYHYFAVSDSLVFHNIGLYEYHLLKNIPGYFVEETFKDYGNNYAGLLSTHQSFWNNLKMNVIVKSLAVLNLFTFRNFYINTLVFNSLVFAGSVAWYRAVKPLFGGREKILAAAIFLYPYALLFTSNIHRDGLVWMSLGFIAYYLSHAGVRPGHIRRLIVAVMSLLLIFAVRNYLSFIVLAALAGWWIAAKANRHAGLIYLLVLCVSTAAFFGSKLLFPAADFPQFVVNRLQDFDEIASVSRTYLPITTLTPDLSGFIKTFPAAFSHSFMMPYPWKSANAFEFAFACEILVIWAMAAVWIYRGRKKGMHPLTGFILFVAVCSVIIIGYTVPNLGAIIRYRSIYVHLLFILLLSTKIFSLRKITG